MRILVCPPDHFDVDYVINPWMEGHVGRIDTARAREQWDGLFDDVARYASIEQVTAQAGSPDMCFTANAGLVEDLCAVPARFRMPERAAEEAPFARWFETGGFALTSLPGQDPFEGEGDALFQPGEPLLWAGYGVRTSLETHRALGRVHDVEVVSLRLVDQHFYHLDTCFAPLPEGRLLYYPAAFDERSRALIEARVPAAKRLPVTDADARNFSCNTLRVEDRLFMNAASDSLVEALASWDYEVRVHPVDEFLKAGGGVKCLSLHLEQPSFDRTGTAPATEISVARVSIQGHLLDDGLLRQLLDDVTDGSGSFRIDALDLAERKDQESRTTLRVAAPDAKRLEAILTRLEAIPSARVEIVPAD